MGCNGVKHVSLMQVVQDAATNWPPPRQLSLVTSSSPPAHTARTPLPRAQVMVLERHYDSAVALVRTMVG